MQHFFSSVSFSPLQVRYRNFENRARSDWFLLDTRCRHFSGPCDATLVRRQLELENISRIRSILKV
jgi:hypothetical protein